MADTVTPADGAYESDRVSAVAIGYVLATVFATVAVAAGVAFWIVGTFGHGRDVASISSWATRVPAIQGDVRLQTDPARDIDAYRRDKESMLHGYAWVDRAHGIARIPIDEAMRLRSSDGASALAGRAREGAGQAR